MEEDRNRKDAALSHSYGRPLKRVRDSGGLESEGLSLRSGSVLKGRTLPLGQISGPQAVAESSAVTVESQAVSSLSERESATATTHSGSAAADPSREITASSVQPSWCVCATVQFTMIVAVDQLV